MNKNAIFHVRTNHGRELASLSKGTKEPAHTAGPHPVSHRPLGQSNNASITLLPNKTPTHTQERRTRREFNSVAPGYPAMALVPASGSRSSRGATFSSFDDDNNVRVRFHVKEEKGGQRPTKIVATLANGASLPRPEGVVRLTRTGGFHSPTIREIGSNEDICQISSGYNDNNPGATPINVSRQGSIQDGPNNQWRETLWSAGREGGGRGQGASPSGSRNRIPARPSQDDFSQQPVAQYYSQLPEIVATDADNLRNDPPEEMSPSVPSPTPRRRKRRENGAREDYCPDEPARRTRGGTRREPSQVRDVTFCPEVYEKCSSPERDFSPLEDDELSSDVDQMLYDDILAEGRMRRPSPRESRGRRARKRSRERISRIASILKPSASSDARTANKNRSPQFQLQRVLPSCQRRSGLRVPCEVCQFTSCASCRVPVCVICSSIPCASCKSPLCQSCGLQSCSAYGVSACASCRASCLTLSRPGLQNSVNRDGFETQLNDYNKVNVSGLSPVSPYIDWATRSNLPAMIPNYVSETRAFNPGDLSGGNGGHANNLNPTALDQPQTLAAPFPIPRPPNNMDFISARPDFQPFFAPTIFPCAWPPGPIVYNPGFDATNVYGPTQDTPQPEERRSRRSGGQSVLNVIFIVVPVVIFYVVAFFGLTRLISINKFTRLAAVAANTTLLYIIALQPDDLILYPTDKARYRMSAPANRPVCIPPPYQPPCHAPRRSE